MGPRGVLHSWATDKDDPTEDPRWGHVGRQKIEDTGPLTRKRMETCDEEFTDKALDFIGRANKHEGKSGQGFYNDVMVAHDENVGKMLAKLEELGIADDSMSAVSARLPLAR
jgi:arylsulfatase A-like enzyme